MMPSLSLSFRPTPKFPTYCARYFAYCAATSWYYFSKGGSRQQGTRAHGSQRSILRAPVPGLPSPWRSSPDCHRDGRPGDTTQQTPAGRPSPGCLRFPPHSSYPLTCRKVAELSSSSFIPCKIRERTIWYVKWAGAGRRDAAAALWGATSWKHSQAAVYRAGGGCQSQEWDPVTEWWLNI